jgi:uncharacterized coiled-coil DUF342 family protein
MRYKNAHIVLFTCLLFSLVSCKTVQPINTETVINDTAEVKEKADEIKDTATTIETVIVEVEKSGEITEAQIQTIKLNVDALKKQTDKLGEIIDKQNKNIMQLSDDFNQKLILHYEELAKQKAENIALTAEKERAEKALKPWRNIALIAGGILLLVIGFFILKIVIKVAIK